MPVMLSVIVPPRDESLADGVAHKPEPVALVRRPDIGSSQHCPATVIPERGQVTEHDSKSSSNECWAVFHKDVAGSNLANDARHVLPHSAALSGDACTPPRDRNVLAWKAANHDVSNSSPRPSVKGLHVIPNRERREASIVLSCHKHGLGVGLPFDGAHASVSKQLAGKDSATSACE
jgi:hypothetical protein